MAQIASAINWFQMLSFFKIHFSFYLCYAKNLAACLLG